MNRVDQLQAISNRLALLIEVCNACISIDGPALDGMAEILKDVAGEIGDLTKEADHEEQ